MKQQIPRWYEKNEYLRAFMNLMQDLDIDTQCEIAVDMIVKSSSMMDRDYSKIIQDVSEYDISEFKRWYDKNPNLHLAIESLRDLTDEQRESIINDFTEKILNNHYNDIEELTQ